jgi:hypothetical protein
MDSQRNSDNRIVLKSTMLPTLSRCNSCNNFRQLCKLCLSCHRCRPSCLVAPVDSIETSAPTNSVAPISPTVPSGRPTQGFGKMSSIECMRIILAFASTPNLWLDDIFSRLSRMGRLQAARNYFPLGFCAKVERVRIMANLRTRNLKLSHRLYRYSLHGSDKERYLYESHTALLIKDTNEDTWSMAVKLLPWTVPMPYPPYMALAHALHLIHSERLEPIYLSHEK